MKFLQKKLALADNAAPDTNDQYHSSDIYDLCSTLSFWLRKLDKICRSLDPYSSVRTSTYFSDQEINHPEKKTTSFLPATDTSSSVNWAPLIKSKPSRTTSSIKPQKIGNCAPILTGQTVLCIGGRSRLYPIYSRLTEHIGGRLMTFHGDPNDQLKDLPRLLEKTDMIICSIDCVNHEAYFMVQFYCRFTGKPCVLLERSESTSFQHGISVLSKIFSEKDRSLAKYSDH
ncbi:DUF2325 domain-containing protein [Nitrosomonas sp. JL21]|uniref:DUF2325 domain-containing protein n=1 Tax=Nitrosomonas sp. JL21 TaxID=153949 RepID=UPI00136871E7|nr:DUF2325 domain-containing protein [Nitrosomonas sp. JL21]MBL8497636.1 DUF2325 domain-containing protein [Nitrosomonas sp.]MXS77768.1 DUF2325 domain-containing protein [Nitrosomonas sp. JL21]